jgi:phosphoribosylformylglycinamidine cyclo-ligase
VLSPGTDAIVDTNAWEPPPIFGEIQRLGDVDPAEMRRVFNCGIGMVLVVPADHVDRASSAVAAHGHRPVVIGEVVAGDGNVRLS